MQKIFLVLLLVATVALGSLALWEHGQMQALSTRIAQLETVAQDKATADAVLQKKNADLQKENEAFQSESASLRTKLAEAATPTPTPDAAKTEVKKPGASMAGGMKSMMEKMLKDPQMKKAIAGQQMVFLKPMYAALIKSLNLSPADADKFFALLSDRTMKMMDAGTAAMNGGKVDTAGMDQDLKAFLGDAGFTQFESYEKSVPDRMALSQVSQQMSTSGTPLQGWQSDGLLQIMQQETVDPKVNLNPQSGAANLTDDQINGYLQATADRNARILNRSRSLLSPDQLNALANSQKQTLQMMQMGLQMSREMTGS